MAVSKRLRYEILRRDDHTCRYCGARAPEVVLTVDHVIPSALGGSDDPSNLVTACQPCNSGKTSSSPDAPVVADVAADALRWSAAMKQAAAQQAADLKAAEEMGAAFYDDWTNWHVGDGESRITFEDQLPSDWQNTIETWRRLGITQEELTHAIRRTMTKPKLKARSLWPYTCGVIWRTLDRRQEMAKALLDAPTPQPEPVEELAETVDDPNDLLDVVPSAELLNADQIARWCELVEQCPDLTALYTDGCRLAEAAQDHYPDIDFIEVWYGYPRFKGRFGEGLKHRLTAISREHDFSISDEHIAYQSLVSALRWAWLRVAA